MIVKTTQKIINFYGNMSVKSGKDVKILSKYLNQKWVSLDSLKKEIAKLRNSRSKFEQIVHPTQYDMALDDVEKLFGEATTGSGVKGKFGCSGAPPKFKPVVAPKKKQEVSDSER